VAIQTPGDLRRQLETEPPGPLYVLTGADEREKSSLAVRMGELIEPELRAFNVERFYGTDRDVVRSIVDAARTLPMMAARRVVVVLQADKLLNPKRRGGADGDGEESSDDLEPLIDYVQHLVPTTTLVFVLDAPDPAADPRKAHALLPLNGGARITRALAKAATIVPCGVAESGQEVAAWLAARAADAGLTVDRAAQRLLVERAGGDLVKFRTDAERVLTYAAGEGHVTVAHVEDATAVHEVSQDDWSLVRAIEQGQAAKALRELKLQLENGRSPFLILGQIGHSLRTPPPRGRYPAARLPRAVDALFETDIALKSSAGDPRVLLERLIVRLCTP
jgi:DNA polymerase III delta subunit